MGALPQEVEKSGVGRGKKSPESAVAPSFKVIRDPGARNLNRNSKCDRDVLSRYLGRNLCEVKTRQ